MAACRNLRQHRSKVIPIPQPAWRWLCLTISLIVALGFFQPWMPSAVAQMADADVLVAEAILSYEHKRYDEAIALLTKATELDPNNARALYYLALCHLARGDAAQAVAPLVTLHAQRPEDVEVTFQLGAAYFATRNYDKADPLLEEVYRLQPDRENLGFYVGVLRYQRKAYDSAATALEGNRSSDPDIQQLALFYRGLALGTLGLSDQAQAALTAAQRVQPTSPITGASVRIQEALAVAAPTPDSRRLHAQVAVGGYYDDNVAVNPRGSRDPVADALRSRPTQSPGFVTSARGDYAWYRSGPIESTITYSYYQTVNSRSEVGRFNIQNHQGGLAGTYRGTLGSMPYEVGTQYSFDYMLLDMRGFMSRHSLIFPATIVPPSSNLPVLGKVDHLSTLLYRFQRKDFFTEPGDSDIRFAPESRDAFNNMLGLLHAFRFQQDRLILRAGYQFDTEAASGSSFSYNGNRLQLGAQAMLPWYELMVRIDYDVHWRAYSDTQAVFLDNLGRLSQRHDIEQDLFLQVSKPLPYHLTWALQYQGVFNHSNVPVYAYSKNVFTTLLTWTY
ncbi:MAG: tetratricopeptide repeat protein [Nitrospiraceae bacterium]|nr:tetratricopeptide repeat protein [Nitrospiraceae bacterium]